MHELFVHRIRHTAALCQASGSDVLLFDLIQDGKPGRIHVEPAAVQVGEEEFRRLVAAPERSEWYAHLDPVLSIRIRRDGSIVPVG